MTRLMKTISKIKLRIISRELVKRTLEKRKTRTHRKIT